MRTDTRGWPRQCQDARAWPRQCRGVVEAEDGLEVSTSDFCRWMTMRTDTIEGCLLLLFGKSMAS